MLNDPLDLSLHAWLAPLPGLVFYKNLDHVYTASTAYTAQLVGFKDSEDLSGNNDFQLRCPAAASAASFQDEDKKVILQGKEIACLQINQFADNKIHIFLLKKAPVRNEQGSVVGICGIGKEITDTESGQAIYNLLSFSKKNNSGNCIVNSRLEICFDDKFESLSNREAEVLFYFVRGFTSKEIASYLSLSPRTVESYIEAIKNKLECDTRSELLLRCMEIGFTSSIPQSILHKYLKEKNIPAL